MENAFECKHCGCTETKEVICETGPHHSRIECAACHKFVKWGKSPANTKMKFIIRGNLIPDWTIPYDEAFAISNLMNNCQIVVEPLELSEKLSTIELYGTIKIGDCEVCRVQ